MKSSCIEYVYVFMCVFARMFVCLYTYVFIQMSSFYVEVIFPTGNFLNFHWWGISVIVLCAERFPVYSTIVHTKISFNPSDSI